MRKEKINVDFGHIVPVSTIDWYKKSSCVVFFNKCPFNCIWCQNSELLKKTNVVDINVVKNKIEESADFVNSIVFSGGEPTRQEKALEALLRFSRNNDLLTGIQTNGYYPLTLKKLVEKGIVDMVFFDMKSSPSNSSKYESITGVSDAARNVFESFKVINMSRVSSEIRTTIFRPFIEDVYNIARFLEENNYRNNFVLQTGIPNNAPDENIRREKRIEEKELNKIARKIEEDTGLFVTCR
jgi:pyruvate formate lyase activating enzyme